MSSAIQMWIFVTLVIFIVLTMAYLIFIVRKKIKEIDVFRKNAIVFKRAYTLPLSENDMNMWHGYNITVSRVKETNRYKVVKEKNGAVMIALVATKQRFFWDSSSFCVIQNNCLIEYREEK